MTASDGVPADVMLELADEMEEMAQSYRDANAGDIAGAVNFCANALRQTTKRHTDNNRTTEGDSDGR